MRILMLDIDTLRPDHLGCYGYHRNTSTNIDTIAQEGVRFDEYYCSDAPCLPSRAALLTGQFGIHSGVVNHGGVAAERRILGEERDFHDQGLDSSFFYTFRKAGFYTASISPFAERHSSYWFNAGLNEVINTGKCGEETADEIVQPTLNWLKLHKDEDNWFLHVNFWDPHTPYRAPMEMGNPFENSPLPDWFHEHVFEEHKKHIGPHSVHEVSMYDDVVSDKYPRQLGKLSNIEELKQFIDNYDTDILYVDQKIGMIINFLKENNLYGDTAIIITSDHGENMGELGIYAEHGTADMMTCRIPMIIKWPGMMKGVVDTDFHYSLDICPTLTDIFNIEPYEKWDGQSYASTLKGGISKGHDYLVLSQCSHVCQRSVRFDKYLYIRTYHDGYHLFNKEMLFNVEEDSHEQNDVAEDNPLICNQACRHMLDWQQTMMLSSDSDVDPMWTVLREGGPFHAKGNLKRYYERLKATGRNEGAELLKNRHAREFE